jgi:hypothetical protein
LKSFILQIFMAFFSLEKLKSYGAAAPASSVMRFCWLPLADVSPAEGHLAIVHPQQAAVGDGHAVRIASQVLEDMLGAAEGGPGIDHPVHSLKLSEESIERARSLPSSEGAAQAGRSRNEIFVNLRCFFELRTPGD